MNSSPLWDDPNLVDVSAILVDLDGADQDLLYCHLCENDFSYYWYTLESQYVKMGKLISVWFGYIHEQDGI